MKNNGKKLRFMAPIVIGLVGNTALGASSLGPSVQLAPAAGAVAIASKKAQNTAAYSGFGAESLSPALIKEFAPPPLDPETTKEIEKLLDLRGQSRGILSSKGTELFFNWRVTGVQQVWKMTQAQGFPIQLTSGEDRTSIVAVSPKDDFILISRDRKGEEFPGLYEMNSAGGNLQVIQHLPKVQTFFQSMSPDGQKILFRSNHVDPKSYVISEFDRKARTITEIFKEPGHWVLMDVNPNQNDWILALLTGSLTREIYQFTRSTGNLVPLLGQNEKEEYEVLFGKKNGEYLVATNKFGDFAHLYLWTPTEKNAWKDLTADIVGEVTDFQISRDRKRIVFTTTENAQSRSHTMSYGSSKIKSLKLPDEILQF
ncbi:MAG: hypothetical protein K2X47_02870, partial [Bdellovibrionales bacterium]|nr:hypothetical protein [Bdellovibrionales bacterium]